MLVRRVLFCCLWAMFLSPAAMAARSAVLIGVDPGQCRRLTNQLVDAGYVVRAAEEVSDRPDLILLQPGHDLPDAQAKLIGDQIRRGGSLLVLLPSEPTFAPLRLMFLMPTSAWKGYERRGFGGPITAAEFDPTFFGPDFHPPVLALPLHIDIRPVHAVERGQARYEQFARRMQGDEWIKLPQKPGETFWTRPLINRDATIRIRGDNTAADGLLVTGRYGAGRVAVFGAGSDQLETWAGQSPATVRKIVGWLAASQIVDSTPPALKVSHTIDRAHRAIVVSIANESKAAATVEAFTRLLSWEGAKVADVSQSVTIAAGQTQQVTLSVPPITPESFQALSNDDAWQVRLGVLTNGGADVVGEERFDADFMPDPRLTVALDDLYAQPYPYNAPHPETMPHFQARLGSGTTRYAYKPGETVHVTVNAANGVRNMAPQASVSDLARPDNPTVKALADGNTKGDQPPTMTLVASGTWSGVEKKDNAVEFTWPQPRSISGVTVVGAATDYRKYLRRNPAAVVVEIDAKEVARCDDLDNRFPAEFGRVRLAFAPTSGSNLTLRFPAGKNAPTLGEVEIDGSESEVLPSAVEGPAVVRLIDAETNTAVGEEHVAIKAASGEVAHATVELKAPKAAGPHAYRIEATFAGRTAVTPLLVTDPGHPLQDVAELTPPGSISTGFIVTRGFRNFFDLGTGTQEMPDPWQSPDDLIWAYTHLLKQESAKAITRAGRLFVASDDFRHYSTPWRTFPSGERMMQLGAEYLATTLKGKFEYADAKIIRYEFSDRWDTGPSIDLLHSWQDYTEFDQWLRDKTGQGLHGQTRPELAKEVHDEHEAEWMTYQKGRYLQALNDLAAPFAKDGKQVFVSGQGVPLVSGADADIVYRMVRGMSDDSTWGMTNEDVPLTTARQMATLAFNPSAAMSTLFMWGWDSSILDNPFWRVPVGTTEPSRRHQYDRAWRGTISWDGTYQSIHTYGYNANGGTSYQMHGNDWQELWRAQERLSLLRPEAPIGVGVVISTATLSDPKTTSFNGAGGDSKSAANQVLDLVPNVVRCLQDAGVSVPFAANASALKNWKGDSPLILLNENEFSPEERAAVKALRDRGVMVVAVHAANFTLTQAGQLKMTLDLPITFAPGTSGYGFVSGGANFVVVEDWREEARTAPLRLKATAKNAWAVQMNDHVALPIRREGDDWLIDVPTRAGDGNLIMVREAP